MEILRSVPLYGCDLHCSPIARMNGHLFPLHDTLLTLHLRLPLTFTCHSVEFWVQESELQETAGATLLQWEKFGKLHAVNSELVPPGEVGFNGFILRNQANHDVYQNCIRTPENTSWWSSLPQTEPCQGMPLSICQKVLKQSLVIIYGGLLWSLVADACSGRLCLIFSTRLPTFHQKHQVVAHVPKMFHGWFLLFYFL